MKNNLRKQQEEKQVINTYIKATNTNFIAFFIIFFEKKLQNNGFLWYEHVRNEEMNFCPEKTHIRKSQSKHRHLCIVPSISSILF